MAGRRLLLLLVALAAIGIPAAVLQAFCIGGSCGNEQGQARVPFCPLPEALRTEIANGYREGRSADVLAVGASTPIFTHDGRLRLPWPSTGAAADPRVPLVLVGPGIATDAELHEGVTLDRAAPTLAEALDLERPFPEVRSGTAIPGAASTPDDPARLVLLIAWKGAGSEELRARPGGWPFLSSLLDQGTGTLEAEPGSLPLDPAAVLATIGTGGLPAQHGITGSNVRNDAGEVVGAFGEGAPVPVIASLADDLAESDPRTLVGLVATEEADRGLVGGGWYPGQEPMDVVVGDAVAAPLAVEVDLSTGYGADDVPDVIGVVLDGGIRRMDRLTKEIVTEARSATDGRTLVAVVGTGAAERTRLAEDDQGLVDAVEEAVPGDARAVDAVVPGGLFLDQDVLRREQVTGQVAVDALLSVEDPAGGMMVADAFQGFAVSFSRYCS
jgi:hypothetical protein